MLKFSMDTQSLYEAFIARDDRFDGQMFACVKTTGIFCKFSCKARKPKLQNCEFVETAAEAISKGYRACKLCKPLGDSRISQLIEFMRADPEQKWTDEKLAQAGFDARTIRRQFQLRFGQTFSQMSKQFRMGVAMKTLENNGRVIDAQIAAGFSSPQGFRDAFCAVTGLKPSAFSQQAKARATWIDTPLGAMIAIADDEQLLLLEFTDRKKLSTQLIKLHFELNGQLGFGKTEIHKQLEAELAEYFEGKRAQFDVPLAIRAEGFTGKVWRALTRIPAGEVRSYGQLATEIGNPKSFRAVANANARNPLAIVVPCHRVIGADGKLAGYAGGVWRKEKLLEIERQYRG